MTCQKMEMELPVLFPPFKFVVLSALTSTHKTSLLQLISPQEERPILYPPYRGEEIGTFLNRCRSFLPLLQQ